MVVEERVDYHLGEATELILKMIGFEPTGPEQAAILRCRKQHKAISGGERSGKSNEAGVEGVLHIFEDTVKFPGEPLLYWLVAADYDRTRAEFNYIADYLTVLGMPVSVSKRVDPGLIEVQYPEEKAPRIRIETKSGKDPRTLAMFAPHGIIACEASQLDIETWMKILSRLTEKHGWLHASGTYEGSLGWWPGVIKAWGFGSETEQSFLLPATTNKFIYPLGENDPALLHLKANSSDEFYMERIKGVAAPPKGLVFKEFRADIHIRDIEYDPDLPIYIWDDPGYGHAHAIEVAQIAAGGQIRVFDEIYERGMITQDMIDMAIQRRWWKNGNKTLVIDPHYADQHQGTHSIKEIWQAPPAELTTSGIKVKIAEGTERLKSFLKVNPQTGEPGIIFSPNCVGVLSELGALPDPFDGLTKVYTWKMGKDGEVVGEEPDDRYNDGIKAIIYGIVERFGIVASADNQFFTMKRYGVRRKERV